MKPKFLIWCFTPVTLAGVALLAAEMSPSPSMPEVPYPDGYRSWQHVSSAVQLPKEGAMSSPSEEGKTPAPRGLIFHIYANEKAVEGYRTGHFPEGAVLIADWFVLEEKNKSLVQGARRSVDVMVRDARFTETGGWGFTKFDKDSHTVRDPISANPVKSCFECHSHAKNHEYVFSLLKP